MTMTLVQTITVGAGGAASISFTGIPQDADDLLVLLSGRNDYASTSVGYRIRLNNDSGSNYTVRNLYGTGSTVGSQSLSDVYASVYGGVPGASATSNIFGSSAIYISNYTSAASKSISVDNVLENNATAATQAILAANWAGTTGVSSIQMLFTIGNFVQYSTASLYKITKA